MEIVFGTSNSAKVDDIRKLIEGTDVSLMTLADLNLNVPDIEENGTTPEENALIKYDVLRPLVPEDKLLVTEDTALEIDTLGGQPGVYARRWSPDQHELTDKEIVEKTLRLMQSKRDRTARFISVFAFGNAQVGRQTVRGELVGQILEKPDAKGMIPGFPYRALFYIPKLSKMLYELHDILPEDREGILTHREKAWRQLEKAIEK